MVAALQPPRVTIVAGEERPRTFDGPRFLQYAMEHSCMGSVEKWNGQALARMFVAACLKYRHAA
jgi:hypothetical protein